LNADLHISERVYEVKSGELKNATKARIDASEAIEQYERTTKTLNTDVSTNTVYDLIGEIVTHTNLTRKTIVKILKKISPQKFALFRKNPEEFIAKCGKLINEVKASLIFNNIVYHKTDERHDATTVFTNTKATLRQSEILKKHIYDYLLTDSKTEGIFAKQLEDAVEVHVYAKLPRSFYITTPIANYSPDWAIVFDREKVRYIYFVAETKGSDSDMELREIEKLKIHCATEHFKVISGQEVKFGKINTYDKLLEIVQVK
jgi:type III restriction enzyme